MLKQMRKKDDCQRVNSCTFSQSVYLSGGLTPASETDLLSTAYGGEASYTEIYKIFLLRFRDPHSYSIMEMAFNNNSDRRERISIMDDKTMKKIRETLSIDVLEKVNGGGGGDGGIDASFPAVDVEEVKKTALAIAAQFGVGIAIDFAEAMGVSRSEAESWFADPQVR